MQHSTQAKMIENVKKCIRTSLEAKYANTSEAEVSELLKIHGITENRLDTIAYCDDIIASNKINDVSIDDNSNKSCINIEAIYQEATAPLKKLVGFDQLYRSMRSIDGVSKETALSAMGEVYDLSLGLSDTTNILKPYCYSFDGSRIVMEGRDFGLLHSKPPRNIKSYSSAVAETVHQLSSNLAGAVAVATLFMDFAHILIYREHVPLEFVKKHHDTRKYIENAMQHFLYSVSNLTRGGIESPFTNVSIFDRVKLRKLCKELDWYFPNENTFEEDFAAKPCYDGILGKMQGVWLRARKHLPMWQQVYNPTEDYIIEYILEVQRIWLDMFNAGDQEQNGMPFRFPVCTINFSKDAAGNIMDNSFFEEITATYDISRFNIFTSEGTKIASCCRLINDAEMMELAEQSNSFGGGGSISLGSHRVCTINFMRIFLESKTGEEFFAKLDERVKTALLVLKAHKKLIADFSKDGFHPFIKTAANPSGLIDISRLFSTIGIMGHPEAIKNFKTKFPTYTFSEEDPMIELLTRLSSSIAKHTAAINLVNPEVHLVTNIEMIPGESFAVRLATADRIIFKEEALEQPMYANQFVPLWEDATIWEKLDKDGKYNAAITGGGIVHAQIAEDVTVEQSRAIIRYATKAGCEHFALNKVYTRCKDCSAVYSEKKEICNCGSTHVEYLTRVVGFFTPVTNWNGVRRDWEFEKRKFVEI